MAVTAAGAMACAADRKNATLNASINYLRPVADTEVLYAYGQTVKIGRSIGVYQVVIKTEKDVEVAVAKVTMFFRE